MAPVVKDAIIAEQKRLKEKDWYSKGKGNNDLLVEKGNSVNSFVQIKFKQKSKLKIKTDINNKVKLSERLEDTDDFFPRSDKIIFNHIN